MLLTCNAIVSLFGAYTSQEAFSLNSPCSHLLLDNVGPNDPPASLLDFHQKRQKAEQQGYLPATGYDAWPHG